MFGIGARLNRGSTRCIIMKKLAWDNRHISKAGLHRLAHLTMSTGTTRFVALAATILTALRASMCFDKLCVSECVAMNRLV